VTRFDIFLIARTEATRCLALALREGGNWTAQDWFGERRCGKH
jgi:hypothetical protein